MGYLLKPKLYNVQLTTLLPLIKLVWALTTQECINTRSFRKHKTKEAQKAI